MSYKTAILATAILLACQAAGMAADSMQTVRDEFRQLEQELRDRSEQDLHAADAFVGDLMRRLDQEGMVPAVREWVKRSDGARLPDIASPGSGPLATMEGVDLDQLIGRHAETLQGALDAENSIPSLLIFASFSMPMDSLRSWIAQANQAGGAVVIRGLIDGSMRKTIEAMQELVTEEGGGGVLVDPRMFDLFGIRHVPVVVVTNGKLAPCENAECDRPVPPHDRIAGQISLDYALREIAAAGEEAAATAAAHLKRLEGRR